MDVTTGLKTTPLGNFPSDWDCRDVGSLDPFVTSGSRGWAKHYTEFGAAFIRITNMSREAIDLDLSDLKQVRVPANDSEANRTQLRVGDVLVSITADIGIVSWVGEGVPSPAYINQHVSLIRFLRPGVNSRYVAYFLAAEASQRAFRAQTDQGAKAGMNLEEVRRVRVALPSEAEQMAIAAALSDVDALLTKLDQLIAKKRDLKQAAMQQLLTGRTRLEGFATPWQHIQMGRLGSFIKGRGLAKDDLARGGELPAVPYTAIYTDFGQIASMMDVAGRVSRSRAEVTVNKPSLLIASSSNMLENIGKAVALCVDDEVAVGGDVLIFRTQADVRFLSYLLSTEVHRRRVVALSQGSTIRHVYAATFSAYEVELPSRDEQVAIADALADIDAELVALEARRNKTHQLKQGMMQALLTGQIRLV